MEVQDDQAEALVDLAEYAVCLAHFSRLAPYVVARVEQGGSFVKTTYHICHNGTASACKLH